MNITEEGLRPTLPSPRAGVVEVHYPNVCLQGFVVKFVFHA